MNVCQRNMARFGHVKCRFDKINDIFSGFWKLGVIAACESPVFQCDRFVQICLLLAPPSF